MNTNYNINYANKEIAWSEDTVKSKLEAIGKLSGKKVAWIQADLSVKKSNCLTRLIWNVVAKHFSWMRKHFYGVDLKQSRSLLIQIGTQLPKNDTIQKIYEKAVEKFNLIVPSQNINLNVEKVNANPKTTLKELGLDTKEKVLNFVKKHGKDLKSLNLKDIKNINNADIEELTANCPKLNHLYLNKVEIDDKGLEHLKTLTSLLHLHVEDCIEITDDGLEHLKALTSLQSLHLSCSYCQITDAGLEHLKALTSLQVLKLSNCENITDHGLEHLKALTSLQKLSLNWCIQITDGGLEHLKALTSLKKLHLLICKQITDDGLEHLKAITSLQSLHLSCCPKISTEGSKELKKALSNVEII